MLALDGREDLLGGLVHKPWRSNVVVGGRVRYGAARAMSTPDIRPETIALINKMAGPTPSDPSAAGEPIDLSWIDPLALGDLWTAAYGTELWCGRHPAQNPAADT